jgi:hypothetical protein
VSTEERIKIAQELLGGGALLTEPWGGYATCPGAGSHSSKNGKRDFRVILEGAPTGYCVHTSCTAAVDAFNLELRRAVWRAEHGGVMSDGTHGTGRADDRNVAAAPRGEGAPKRRDLDMEKVRKVTDSVPAIDREWLRRRSPIDVSKCGFAEFFGAVYEPGDRVLVFTRFTSQGDFLWWVGKGGFRLGDREGLKAVPSELPGGAKCGVWFLANPVDGGWHEAKYLDSGGRRLSRRSETAVTKFRYLVLESDTLEEALWLKVLVKLPLPIVAIYTSGSKSIHALVHMGAESKAEWDHMRNELQPLLTTLGADGAAMSAVRLTRLPFTLRRGSESRAGNYIEWKEPGRQELLFLDAMLDMKPILSKPIQRD